MPSLELFDSPHLLYFDMMRYDRLTDRLTEILLPSYKYTVILHQNIFVDLLSSAWDRINPIIGIPEWVKPVCLALTLGSQLRVLGPGLHFRILGPTFPVCLLIDN